MSDFFTSVKALVFPQKCIFCGTLLFANATNTCPQCASQLPYISGKRCNACGCEKRVCSCMSNSMYYDRFAAPLYYEGVVRASIHKMKFHAHPEVARSLAVYMEQTVREVYADESFDFVTFVPMRTPDRRRRGYNQSEQLARQLAERLSLPLRQDVLRKIYPTAQQAMQNRLQRTGNVMGAFDAEPLPEGSRILLVDDVRTTGSTLSECGKMLYLAGASRVCCISAATVKKSEKKEG